MITKIFLKDMYMYVFMYICLCFMFFFSLHFFTRVWNLASRLYIEYSEERQGLKYLNGLQNDTQSFSLDLVAARKQ